MLGSARSARIAYAALSPPLLKGPNRVKANARGQSLELTRELFGRARRANRRRSAALGRSTQVARVAGAEIVICSTRSRESGRTLVRKDFKRTLLAVTLTERSGISTIVGGTRVTR